MSSAPDRRRLLFLGDTLAGELEVALGLETVHPRALPRLGKRMSLADFDRASGARGIAVRAFVLVGAPFVPPAKTLIERKRLALQREATTAV